MTFGQKIKKLRVDAGLTQKELADKMNVSFQTVSKWESDQNEPDISCIKLLSKIFNCSIEYLFNDDASSEVDDKGETKNEVKNSIICKDCGKELFDNGVIHTVERKGESGEIESISLCDECYDKHQKELDDKVNAITKSYAPKNNKKSNGIFHKITSRDDSKVLIWAIVVGVVALIIPLIICIVNYQKVGIGATIAVPLIVSYALFSDVYCVFTASWVSDVFMEVASWSIKMPGIIFTFDLDGIKFLIFMKIFLWVLSIMISVAAFLLAVLISAVCSIFTFPFLIVYNKKHYL